MYFCPSLCTLRIMFEINSAYNKSYIRPLGPTIFLPHWSFPSTMDTCAHIPWTFFAGGSLFQNAIPQIMSWIPPCFLQTSLQLSPSNVASQGHFIQNRFRRFSFSVPALLSQLRQSYHKLFIYSLVCLLSLPHRNE